MHKSQINHDILGHTTIIPYHTILAASSSHYHPIILPIIFPIISEYPYNTPMISSGDDRFPMLFARHRALDLPLVRDLLAAGANMMEAALVKTSKWVN
jgi:hypothetical protein